MADETEALARLQKLRTDLEYFGAECLKLRDKEGNFVPLVLNAAQRKMHDRIEAQRAELGYVRAIVLKGRQQGISTYTAARFYQRAAMRRGTAVYILAHEQAASDTLFGMVDRYQRGNPSAPHVGASNAKELIFDRLDSSYTVATAGTKAGGRSKATSLFHGSEVAFWANAKDHFAASVQGVPMARGTEIVLESTSAGGSGVFYDKWHEAEAGLGDYIPIFLEWWLTTEYARDLPPGFVLENEDDVDVMSEQEYADTFKLSARQMMWRRGKLHEMGSTNFRREYPATPQEAWVTPEDHTPFIVPLLALRARTRQGVVGAGPLVFGVDPASNGGDRFSVAARRGMKVEWVEHRNKVDTLEGTEWIRSLIEKHQPARVNIDAGNIGAAIVTNLKSLGPRFVNIVRGVDFGAKSEWRNATPKVPGPYNRRAEMWKRMRDWLEMPEGASIPDNSAIDADMVAPKHKPRLDNFYLLESKPDMKARGVRSPDLADAIALTFAFSEWLTGYAETAKVPTFGNVDSQKATTPYANYDIGSGGSTGWMF